MTYARPIACIATLALSATVVGCASAGPVATDPPRSLADAAANSGSVPLIEMDITNKVFIEWYLSRLGQAAEQIITGNPSAEARREASLLRFMQGTSAYAIGAGPNAYVQLLDLVALITLERIQWIEEGRAREIFGDRAGILEGALQDSYERVLRRAETYMTPEEVAHLDEVIRGWRERNPGLRALSFIRMADFAHELAVSMGTYQQQRGILARIAETNREIDEARLLGERALYLGERSPLLLGWRVEAIVSDLMTHPDLAGAWEGLEEITSTAAGLEARLSSLETLLGELPEDLLRSVKGQTDLDEALATVAALGPVVAELSPAVVGLESSLTRIATLVDELQRAYTLDVVRAEADQGVQRAVREARGLILLATACVAFLLLLFFALRRLLGTGRPPS